MFWIARYFVATGGRLKERFDGKIDRPAPKAFPVSGNGPTAGNVFVSSIPKTTVALPTPIDLVPPSEPASSVQPSVPNKTVSKYESAVLSLVVPVPMQQPAAAEEKEESAMNIFSTVIKDVESDASKVESELKRIFGDIPTWTSVVGGTVTLLGPYVGLIAAAVGGPAASADVTAIINDIKKGLAAVSVAAQGVDAATTVPQLLATVQSSLPALLSAAQVKSTATTTQVEGWVSYISNEIDALIDAAPKTAALPTETTTAPAAEQTPAPSVLEPTAAATA